VSRVSPDSAGLANILSASAQASRLLLGVGMSLLSNPPAPSYLALKTESCEHYVYTRHPACNTLDVCGTPFTPNMVPVELGTAVLTME
jgi:hypothetical protein